MSSAPSQIKPPKLQSYESGVRFPQRLLNVGFGFALLVLRALEEKKGKVYSSPGILLVHQTLIIGGGKSGGGKSRVRRRAVKKVYKLDKSKPLINVDDMIR